MECLLDILFDIETGVFNYHITYLHIDRDVVIAIAQCYKCMVKAINFKWLQSSELPASTYWLLTYVTSQNCLRQEFITVIK